MQTRFVAYDRLGARRGVIPDPLEATVTSTLNELSVVNLQYARSGLNSAFLDNAPELSVEWFDGSTWVEMRDARLRLLTTDFDHLEEVPTRRYDFIGVGEALKGVLVYGVYGLPTNKDGNPQFKVSTAGRILATIWDNAVSRGWTGFSYSFSPTADSNGQPWAQNFTISYSVDNNLLNILQGLVAQGIVDFYWQGRTLHVYNAGTYLARDASVGLSPIKFDGGLTGIDAAPEMEDVSNLATHVVVLGENKLRWEFPTGTIIPEGRREIVLSYSGVDEVGTAQILANPHILRAQNFLKNTTRQFHLNDNTVMHPHEDYLVGDWVKVLRGTTYERMRIYSINLQRNANGLQGYVQLGDRVDDLLEIMYARIQGLTGGVGNEGGTPAAPTGRVPAAPTGLALTSDAFIDESGKTQGVIQASWAHSGKDTNGETIVIDEFVAYYRKVGDTSWKRLLSTPLTTGTESPIPVYDGNGDRITYQVRVVAFSGTGIKSASSSTVNILMANDVTAPYAPYFYQANVTTWLMTTKVTWNGKLTSNGTTQLDPPPDFDHIEVFRDTQLSMATEVKIGEMYGEWDFANEPATVAGQTLYYRLYAVDRSGNRSAPSVVKGITPQANVDLSKITAAIDAAAIQISNAGSIVLQSGSTLTTKLSQNDAAIAQANTDISGLQTSYSTQSGQITALQTSVSGKNKIVNSTSDASGTTAYVSGDRWQKWSTLSTGGKLLASWRYNGTTWVPELIDPVYIPQIDIGAGTFGSLDGGRLVADSVKTSSLMVSDLANFAPSPAESPGDWEMSGGMTIVATGLDDVGQRFHQDTSASTGWARGPFMAVKPGQKLYGYGKIYRGTGTQNVYVRYYWYDATKSAVTATPYTVLPNGDFQGATGSVYDGAVTVPAGTAYARYTFAVSAGSGTVGLYSVDGFRQSSTVQIANGAVTANEINASSVGAAVGTFVQANVSNLVVTGTANMDTAVVDKFWAEVVRAKDITADMLNVGRGSNMISWNVKTIPSSILPHTVQSSGVGQFMTDTAHSGTTSYYITGATVPNNTMTTVFRFRSGYVADNGRGDDFNVIAGDPMVLETWIRSGGSYANGEPDIRLQVVYMNSSGVQSSVVYSPLVNTDFTWQKISFEFVPPAGAASLYINIQQNQPGGLRIDDPYMAPQMQASFISQGAILAPHLTVTEEMWAKVIKFKKLTGGEIDATALTADTGWIGTLRGGILINDSVDTGMLKADAITSKHTLTGPVIQTVATASRGIKIENNLLRAWDAVGNETFAVSGNTGNVIITGKFKTGLNGNFAELTTDSYGGLLRFWTGNSTQRGTIYARSDAGGDRMTLTFQDIDNPASTIPLVGVLRDRVNLSYGSKRIQVWDNAGTEELLLESSGANIVVRGGIDMREGGNRVRFRYQTTTQLGYVGQRPESGTSADFEFRADAGGVRLTGTDITAFAVYNNTTASSANVNVDSGGVLRRVSSASRYKADQQVMELSDALLDIPVKDWTDKAAYAQQAEMDQKARPFIETDQQKYEALVLSRIPGVIAEDVEQCDGSQFVIYGPDGRTESVMYDRLAVAQIAVLTRTVRAQQTTIDELVARMNAAGI